VRRAPGEGAGSDETGERFCKLCVMKKDRWLARGRRTWLHRASCPRRERLFGRLSLTRVRVIASLVRVVISQRAFPPARRFGRRRAAPPRLEELHRFLRDSPLGAGRQVGGDVNSYQFASEEKGTDFVRAYLPPAAEIGDAKSAYPTVKGGQLRSISGRGRPRRKWAAWAQEAWSSS